jgi:hypothetical protein
VSFALMMLSDDRANLISPLADTITALALFALLVALALLAAWRSWTEAALVGMGFAAAFALAVIFTAVAGPMLRIDVALLTAPTGLAFAVQVAAFARGGRAVRWLAVGLTALLAMALIWQYKVVVFAALGSPYDLRFFRVLASIAMVGLASPPLLAWLAGRRRQLPPRVS